MTTDHRRIAKIESTMLGYEDHGIFTAMLHVTYGSSAQAIGGLALSEPRHAAAFILGVLRACGVDRWEKLSGRTIHVLFADSGWNARPIGIENLPTEPGGRFLFAELDAAPHDARSPFLSLTDEQRCDLMRLCCYGCGTTSLPCQCMRDL